MVRPQSGRGTRGRSFHVPRGEPPDPESRIPDSGSSGALVQGAAHSKVGSGATRAAAARHHAADRNRWRARRGRSVAVLVVAVSPVEAICRVAFTIAVTAVGTSRSHGT